MVEYLRLVAEINNRRVSYSDFIRACDMYKRLHICLIWDDVLRRGIGRGNRSDDRCVAFRDIRNNKQGRLLDIGA